MAINIQTGNAQAVKRTTLPARIESPPWCVKSVSAFLRFLHSLQKRGPSKEYVQELEDRIEKLESFIRHVCITFCFLSA